MDLGSCMARHQGLVERRGPLGSLRDLPSETNGDAMTLMLGLLALGAIAIVAAVFDEGEE